MIFLGGKRTHMFKVEKLKKFLGEAVQPYRIFRKSHSY